MIVVKRNPVKTNILGVNHKQAHMKNNPSVKPVVTIDENEEEYLLYAVVPGMEKKDIQISSQEGVLTIKGVIVTLGRFYRDRCDYSLTEWSRSIHLPSDADVLMSTAIYQNGELVIHIPKGKEDSNNASMNIYVY